MQSPYSQPCHCSVTHTYIHQQKNQHDETKRQQLFSNRGSLSGIACGTPLASILSADLSQGTDTPLQPIVTHTYICQQKNQHEETKRPQVFSDRGSLSGIACGPPLASIMSADLSPGTDTPMQPIVTHTYIHQHKKSTRRNKTSAIV
jgi:hypothetical protein